MRGYLSSQTGAVPFKGHISIHNGVLYNAPMSKGKLKSPNPSMFVGGELYTDHRWNLAQPTLTTQATYFLNGGKACLIVISDFLLAHNIDRILLPAYLCPSILTAFERRGLKCDFYQVNEDLSIDLQDLAQKMDGVQAVYFINYFGFFPAPPVLAFLQGLRENGVIVVEDNAQAGFHDHPTGDFILNSLRKFVAHDGGYLITQQDMAPYLASYRDLPNRRLPIIRDYRKGLYRYLIKGQGDFDALEAKFALAEAYYDTDFVVLGDPQEQEAIERLDWPQIKQIRRDNYQYLLGLIASIPEISPIFPLLPIDNMPSGLPVYFSGVSRDEVNRELGNAQIGLTIHWEEILDNPRTQGNRLAVEMAGKMLTLVIDQRTSRKQLDYLASNLVKAIATVKSRLK